MSIIKNDARNIRNTGLTIAILPSNARIPLPNNYNYGTLEYIAMKGQALDTTYMWYTGAGETVILKCEIEQNASGTIYGTANSNGYGIKIVKDGANIKWYNRSTLVHTQAWSAGVHYIGWVATDDTHSCPFYDNVSYTSEAVALSQHSLAAGIGGLNNNNTMGSFLTSSAAWAMKLYEVIAYSYLTDTYSNMFKYRYQLYAAHALNETTYYGMLDLRYSLSMRRPTPTTTDLSSLNGPRVQYGVQIHDIKEVCNSPFNDLVAIASELGLNGGVDTDAGWTANNADSPSKVTSVNVEHKFAFYMGSTSDHIPLPSGATITGTPSLGYEKGGLIRGLKPKWSIWSDVIKAFFYVANVSGVYKMRCNILKCMDFDGARLAVKSGKCHLEWFNGYNTSPSAIHAPKLEVRDAELGMEIHNGQFVNCMGINVFAGQPGYSIYNESTKQRETLLDQEAVYEFDTSTKGDIYSRIGNIAPWNYTNAQLSSKQYLPLGYKVMVNFGSQNNYMSAVHSPGSPYLCADLDATTKELYRNTGFSDSLELTKNKWFLLDYMDANNNTANMEARMVLQSDLAGGDSGNINLDELIPHRNVTFTGVRDSAIQSGSNNFRLVLDTEESIGMVVPGHSVDHISTLINYTYYQEARSAISLGFIGCTQGTEHWPDSYGRTVYAHTPTYAAVDYLVVMELHYMKNGQYAAAVFAQDSMTLAQLQSNYPQFYNTVWGYNDVSNTQTHSLWRRGRTSIPKSDNTNLATYSRFFAMLQTDFFGPNGSTQIPTNTTAIAHIYKKSTAPVIAILRDFNTWDAEHHVNKVQLPSAGSLGARMLAFAKLFYKSTTKTHIAMQFLAYDPNNNYAFAAMRNMTVEVYKGNALWCYFEITDFNYKPQGMDGTTSHSEQYYGLVKSGSSWVYNNNYILTVRNNSGADELIHGLNNVYWEGAYFEFGFDFPSASINNGDVLKIDITNP